MHENVIVVVIDNDTNEVYTSAEWEFADAGGVSLQRFAGAFIVETIKKVGHTNVTALIETF